MPWPVDISNSRHVAAPRCRQIPHWQFPWRLRTLPSHAACVSTIMLYLLTEFAWTAYCSELACAALLPSITTCVPCCPSHRACAALLPPSPRKLSQSLCLSQFNSGLLQHTAVIWLVRIDLQQLRMLPALTSSVVGCLCHTATPSQSSFWMAWTLIWWQTWLKMGTATWNKTPTTSTTPA